jgi:hypothetical protein
MTTCSPPIFTPPPYAPLRNRFATLLFYLCACPVDAVMQLQAARAEIDAEVQNVRGWFHEFVDS